jgi:hypothetical protein
MTQTLSTEAHAAEELISQVRGVMAVRVVRDEQGRIDEIHVVGSPERSAKQMVRDVESILYVRGGVRVDHRKISLVQVAETALQPSEIRVRVLDVLRAADEQGPAITVTLGMGEQRVLGLGRSRPNRDDSPEYLAGYATIHALNQVIGSRGQLRLEHLQRQAFGGLEVCLSHLSLVTDDGIEVLLGVCVERDDELMTAVRAVLDAVNRPLQRILSAGTPALRS